MCVCVQNYTPHCGFRQQDTGAGGNRKKDTRARPRTHPQTWQAFSDWYDWVPSFCGQSRRRWPTSLHTHMGVAGRMGQVVRQRGRPYINLLPFLLWGARAPAQQGTGAGSRATRPARRAAGVAPRGWSRTRRCGKSCPTGTTPAGCRRSAGSRASGDRLRRRCGTCAALAYTAAAAKETHGVVRHRRRAACGARRTARGGQTKPLHALRSFARHDRETLLSCRRVYGPKSAKLKRRGTHGRAAWVPSFCGQSRLMWPGSPQMWQVRSAMMKDEREVGVVFEWECGQRI